ncbi:hypothetical protein ABIB94_001683 [Bradyrhizobium sp. JR7.2]
MTTGGGLSFSIWRKIGNEFAGHGARCASVMGITAKCHPGCEISSKELSHDRPRRPEVRQPEAPRSLYALLQGVPFNSGVALTMKLINASSLKLLSNLLLLSALPASSDACLLGAPRPR